MTRKQTRKNWLIALCLMMMPSLLLAQSYTKKTLITLGDKEISVKEFMDTYEKNNINTDVIDKKNVEDYLDLYIDFKLKVTEAEDLKMDTSAAFIKELQNYRQQLAKPYFSNDDITDELVQEAYDRMQYDINAAHILIRCDANAIPADTLAAYKKAMSIRERILKGEDFGDVAVEMSDDPSARDMEEIPGIDKLVHICMYGGLCFLLWIEYLRAHRTIHWPKMFIGGILMPIAFSGCIELAQSYCTEHRGGDWLDLCSNTTGVLLAALVGYYILRPLVWNKKK